MKTKWKLQNLFYLLLVILMIFYPQISGQSGYLMTLFVMITVYAISAMSLNLLIGYGGQISVGHSAFLTIGSYCIAILTSKLGLPILVALPLTGIITGLIGLIIGLPAVRLSGHFLAVATLGFGLSIPHIALNWESLTGGFSGLAVLRPSWLSSDLQLFYAIVVLAVLITWILHNILISRFGRAFTAIRESEIAAQATGINISFYKTLMFVISSFFTGIAGGIYAYWIGYVSPNDFTLSTSFLLLGMIVVGGLASIPGAIIGAILFTILPELTSSFIGLTNVVIGVAIVVIILFKPTGIVSMFAFANRKNRIDIQALEKYEDIKGGEPKNANI